MKNILFFIRLSGRSYKSMLLLIFWALLSGLLNFIFIIVVNMIVALFIRNELLTRRVEFFWYAVAAMSVFTISRRYFSYGIINFSQHFFWNLRKELTLVILQSEYMKIRELHNSIHSSLIRDINSLTNSSLVIIEMTTSAILITGCLVYMAFLSFPLFLVSFLTIVLGITLYNFSAKKNHILLRKSRELEQDFVKHFNAVLGGIKELNVEYNKGHDIYSGKITKVAKESLHVNRKALVGYLNDQIFGLLLFYMLITVIMLYLSFTIGVEKTVVVNFVFLLLYVLGPIENIMVNIPLINQSIIAANKIVELKSGLESDLVQVKQYPAKSRLSAVRKITVYNLTYKFPHNDNSFVIGPVNFMVNAGEIVFIYGGNGTGKTTFLYSFLHLVTPLSGEIFIDDIKLDHAYLPDYKKLFSPVFSDFYLFDELFGITEIDYDKLSYYLHLFEIDEKVNIVNGVFSTTNLSTGQRKRLALIASLMENKPFLVLDEWAADQDPGFRRKFYLEIVPVLQKEGFTIIAITHDDQYFHCASKLYKMEDGQLQLVDQVHHLKPMAI